MTKCLNGNHLIHALQGAARSRQSIRKKLSATILAIGFLAVCSNLEFNAHAEEEGSTTEKAVRTIAARTLKSDSLTVRESAGAEGVSVTITSILPEDRLNRQSVLALALKLARDVYKDPSCAAIKEYNIIFDASNKNKRVAVLQLKRSVAEKVEWQNMDPERFGVLLQKHGHLELSESASKTTEQIREDQIQRQFSGWDGSHRALTALIKKSMNDPGSYEHVKTVYWDKGDHLIVTTNFRGKNAFGGLVLNSVTATVDLEGNVIEIVSQ